MQQKNANRYPRLQNLTAYVMFISILLVIYAFPTSHAYAKRYSYGYSYDIDPGYRNSSWMQNLKDNLLISELSIIGTHNSMSLYGGGGPYPDDYIRTQRMPLATQLNAGIRYLDIRVRHLNDTFVINHGRIYQNAHLGPDVLDKIIDFLKTNPNETILMRLKRECVDNPSIGECTDSGTTRSFSDTFEHEYYNNNRYSSYFWKDNYNATNTNSNPQLGEVRGKIIVLENFPVSKTFGISYKNLDTQDYFDVDDEPHAMYEKWTQIKSHLIKANTAYEHTIFLNHLSGNGGWRFFTKGASPYFVASGQYHKSTGGERTLLTPMHGRGPVDLRNKYPDYPRLYSVDYNMNFIYYEGTNILTTEKIQAGSIKHTGIIAADFPGKSLIDSIIKLNNQHSNN
ncbi:phosphatidylinositol-specific phospholipase C [Bacillus mycoides]|uniref:phosphatidylinositol-specific phospholipase C n=1 Tax=Bacillus mycoides TaxID=1405 RepID=UPI002111711B|nr:phosphatidylinositol-specific phospholipase C [Bacillus mycoides]MCQ6530462.1 phosphatidylinositol-specific phospholipase C [Bacillus mycoides]